MLPLASIHECLRAVIHATTKDESRYALDGVHFEFNGELMRTVATDGHRLALGERTFDGSVPRLAEVLIPRKAVGEILKLKGETVEFAHDENCLLVKAEGVTLIARKLSGNFPDYKMVMPESSRVVLVVERAQMLEEVSRALLLADERNRAIALTLTDAGVTVKASTGAGEHESFVGGEYETEVAGVTVSCNGNYLVDALKSMSTPQVIFKITDADRQMEIVNQGGSTCDQRNVIMPMRV